MNKLLILFLLLSSNTIFGQVIKGTLLNAGNHKPIEFANIGIVGKNIGTVSDLHGNFSLKVNADNNNDTVLISVIGYESLSLKISDLKRHSSNELFLKEKNYTLNEVVIKPNLFKQKILGVTAKSDRLVVGFQDNKLGYELGIKMKVKKTALLKIVNINIANCSYDTIFYRLNIYKVHKKNTFENILQEPIYLKMSKELVKGQVQIDLQSKNIVVQGDFLITLEHIKDLGSGNLNFCAGLRGKTYYRKTSQGNWETIPIGVSISVIADVEK